MWAIATGRNFMWHQTDFFIDFKPGFGAGAWNVSAGYDTSSMSCPIYCKNCPPPTDPNNRTSCPAMSAPLPLKATDKTLEIAVWIDNVFAEVFFMGGRAAWTVPLPCEAIQGADGGAAVFARGGAAQLVQATAWDMRAIEYEDVGPDASRT